MSNSLTGHSWIAMMNRCFRKNHNSFNRYGGRGITVCEFIQQGPQNIISIIGERPFGKTLDRKDNDLHYSCGKCDHCKSNGWIFNIRWATKWEQSNNKSSNVILKSRGETVTVAALNVGADRGLIYQRLKRGWSESDVFIPPTDENNYKTISGITKSIKEWASQAGISSVAFAKRIRKGWTEQQLLLPRQMPKQISKLNA